MLGQSLIELPRFAMQNYDLSCLLDDLLPIPPTPIALGRARRALVELAL